MPLYEYKCNKCGAGFEVLVRNESDVPEKCPKCGATKIEKLLSPFAPSGGSDGTSFCDSGNCGTSSCPTGTCPFGG